MILYFGTVYLHPDMRKEPTYFCYKIKSNINTYISKAAYWNQITKIIFLECIKDKAMLDVFIEYFKPDKCHPIHDNVRMWFTLQYSIECLNRGYWSDMTDDDIDTMQELSENYKAH